MEEKTTAHTKLRLVSKLFGMESAVGTVKVEFLARDRWEDSRKKILTRKCPKCGTTMDNMTYNTVYKCTGTFEGQPCTQSYSHWSQMKEIVIATGADFEKERLLQPKEEAKGYLFRLSQAEYSKRIAATAQERGLTTADSQTAKNLRKMIVAQEKLGVIIAVKWKDTYEEKVGIFTVNEDNTIVLKELIPDNLIEVNTDVLKADKSAVTSEELKEAEAFLGVLPEADAETFRVKDYRAEYLGETPTSNVKVQSLSEVLKASKARAEAAATATTSWRKHDHLSGSQHSDWRVHLRI